MSDDYKNLTEEEVKQIREIIQNDQRAKWLWSSIRLWSLWIGVDGYPTFYARDASGAFSGRMVGKRIETNSPYRFVIKYSGDDKYFYMYENGLLVSKTEANSPIWPVSGDIAIGSNLSGTESLNGSLKNVRIKMRALTDTEIAAEGAPK